MSTTISAPAQEHGKGEGAKWTPFLAALAPQIEGLNRAVDVLQFLRKLYELRGLALDFYDGNIDGISAGIKTLDDVHAHVETLTATIWKPWGWPDLLREMQRPAGRLHKRPRRKIPRLSAERFIREKLFPLTREQLEQGARRAQEKEKKRRLPATDADFSDFSIATDVIDDLDKGKLQADLGMYIGQCYHERRRRQTRSIRNIWLSIRNEMRTKAEKRLVDRKRTVPRLS